MGRITSSTGLITGIPIEETVKKLMQVASRPRDLVTARNTALTQQQAALDTLGSRLLAFQFAVNKLKTDSVYKTRNVVSSAPTALTATAPSGSPPSIGAFQIQPVRAASAQSLVSQRFEGVENDLGDGMLRIGFGGFVDQGIGLEQLNSGAGIQRGKIKITDRAGTAAVIDLRHARTVDDVLNAINSNSDIAVTAKAVGDSFQLIDGSGGSGNLVVQEVGGGTTAASLGLAGISVAADVATGGDVLTLHAGAKLTTLNDGNGVRLTVAGVKDLDVTLSDGTALEIDLAGAVTLGDVVSKINAAGAGKLTAAIASDGRRLQLNDTTGGSGDFKIDDGPASSAAEDLGVIGTGVGGVLTGKRLISGLRDSLLSRLQGGAGLGELGAIDVTDRSGGAATIDLSSAETLGDVVKRINDSSGADVAAAINGARNGIVITDESGGSGNLTIANGDGANTADALKLTVNGAVGQSNSGALHRQTLSRATLLSSLNGGKGVTLGDIKITDAAGVEKSADLDPDGNEAKTVGDVIDRINRLSNGVEARINDTGDGILLTNTATGSGGLKVQDLNGNIAASLNLTKASKTIDVGGTPTIVIDGSRAIEINLSDLEFSAEGIALSSVNNGNGIDDGDLIIYNSQGNPLALDLNGADSGISTVGQLIDAINAKSAANDLGITASVNRAGTGIKLMDSKGGSQRLKVENVGASTSATDLKLNIASINSGNDQVIDGGSIFSSGSGAQTGLKALAERINDRKAGVVASTVFDGTGYRLSLAVQRTGDANQVLIDSGGSVLAFEEVHKASDALLLYGDFNSSSGGVLLSSPDGVFNNSVGGVNVQVLTPTDAPVTVTVSQTDASLVAAVKDFVSAFNALRGDLAKLTSFDSENLTTGLLFGTNEALQIDSRLSRVLTNRYFGLGEFQSLQQIGIGVEPDGTLNVDNAKLQKAFEENPDALQTFLADADDGVVVKLNAAIKSLAGDDDSLLAARSDAIKATIEANTAKIDRMTLLLEKQEERLFLQFTKLESIVAQMQSFQTALAGLQVLEPLNRNSR